MAKESGEKGCLNEYAYWNEMREMYVDMYNSLKRSLNEKRLL